MKKLLLILVCSVAYSYSTFAQIQLVSTLAGQTATGTANGTGAAASFNAPDGVCVDAFGNIYVADTENHLIRKITPAGVVTTLAGSGTSGLVNGTGTAASFSHPGGLCADLSGNIYVADTYNNVIRKITPAGVVTTLAGATPGGFSDGPAATAQFNNPNGICYDFSTGNLYVADRNNQRIRLITAGGVVSTFAGSGAIGAANATGILATFNYPTGICIDASANLYVGDANNNMIRKITSAAVVTTFAGSGTAGALDATGTAATFNSPGGVSTDGTGTIFVADFSNSKIRTISASGVVTTLTGFPGFGFLDGNVALAELYRPLGVACYTGGVTYIADRNNNRIRMISPCTVPAAPTDATSSSNATVCTGNSTTLAATASGTATVTWFAAATGGTAISTGTAYITSSTLTAGTHTFYAEANTCTVSASRTPVVVTISICCTAPNAPVNVTPVANATICAGQSATLSATATGTATISWFLTPSGGSAVGTGTTYITPPVLPAGNYTIYAEASTCTVSATRTAISLVVSAAPAAPTNVTAQGNTTVCAGSSTTLSATGTGNISWFTNASGGTAVSTGTDYVTSTTLTAGTYTFYAEASTCTVSASRTPVVLTVSFCCVAPNAPVNTTPFENAFTCPGLPNVLSVTSAGTVHWYATASGGAPVSTGTVYTTPILPVGTYTYYAEATTCTVSPRTAITSTVDVCESIQQHTQALVSMIYPNPTSSAFTMEFKNAGVKTIVVMDVTGCVALTHTTTDTTVNINLQGFANGIYYVKAQTANAVEVHKIIKH